MTASFLSEAILKKLPKVDLHCHLDGAVRPSTILELGKKHNIKLKADHAEKLKKFVQVDTDCHSLTDFLDCFENFYDVLKFPDAMERISYELSEDISKENVKYAEIRYAPCLLESEKMTAEGSVRAVIRGLSEGRKKFGAEWGIILCMYRSLPKETAIQTVQLAEKFKNDGVVGLDLAGDESKYSIGIFKEVFETIQKKEIPVTCHAGEAAGVESIKEAVKLGAKRIGHGIRILEDRKFYQEMIERQIPFEICVTSNLQTQTVRKLNQHPLPGFFRDGLAVTLNTDDREVSGIDLTHEYRLVHEKFRFSFEDCGKLVLNGVNALFLNHSDKNRIRTTVKDELDKLHKIVSEE